MAQQVPLDPETTEVVDMWVHDGGPKFKFVCTVLRDGYGNTMNQAQPID